MRVNCRSDQGELPPRPVGVNCRRDQGELPPRQGQDALGEASRDGFECDGLVLLIRRTARHIKSPTSV